MARTRDQIYDELLVLRSRAGDQAAFGELVVRWQQRLFGHALQLTGQRDVALDAVQETWLTLIRELDRLQDPARFAGFAHRILARRCADQVRRQRRRCEVACELGAAVHDAPDHRPAESASDATRLREAIDRLPSDRRVLLALHYLYELPLADIARMLRVPVGTVKSRLHDARGQLRGVLEPRRQPCPS